MSYFVRLYLSNDLFKKTSYSFKVNALSVNSKFTSSSYNLKIVSKNYYRGVIYENFSLINWETINDKRT